MFGWSSIGLFQFLIKSYSDVDPSLGLVGLLLVIVFVLVQTVSIQSKLGPDNAQMLSRQGPDSLHKVLIQSRQVTSSPDYVG